MLTPAGHPFLLLGGAQTDEQKVGLGGGDLGQDGLLVFEIAVVSAAQDQIGIAGADAAARLLRHAGLGPQQIEPPAHLVQGGEHGLGKLDAGDPLLQGRA